MNEEQKDRAKKPFPWIGMLVAAFLMVIALSLLFPVQSGHGPVSKRLVARNELNQIHAALKFYIAEFGIPPIGGSAQIMAALQGGNPRHIVCFEADAKRFNSLGEFLDPWGTPYRIDASNPEFPWAYSFGKNTTDEGGAESSDDVSSWQ